MQLVLEFKWNIKVSISTTTVCRRWVKVKERKLRPTLRPLTEIFSEVVAITGIANGNRENTEKQSQPETSTRKVFKLVQSSENSSSGNGKIVAEPRKVPSRL